LHNKLNVEYFTCDKLKDLYNIPNVCGFACRNRLGNQSILLIVADHRNCFVDRNDTSWKPEPPPPIDYCYVRPHHIPAVNALCREHFWPGIDS